MVQEKIKVLIADDNKEFCKMVSDIFSLQDDIVVTGVANDGLEALKLIEEKNPDIAVLDMIMPKLDGLGVLEKLNTKAADTLPKTIMLSAIGEDRLTQRALSLGADYYIVKPFNMEVLTERIRQLYSSITPYEQVSLSPAAPKKIPDVKEISNYDFSDLEVQITELIHQIGIPAHISGYKYIKEAITIFVEEEGQVAIVKELYPAIADKYNSTPGRVERSIRHAIGIACERGKSDIIRKILNNSTQNLKSKPSNALFIASLSDMLRLSNRIQQ